MNKMAKGEFVAQMNANDWVADYRFSFQLGQLIGSSKDNVLATTTDRIPCYDVNQSRYSVFPETSVSCLMYNKTTKNEPDVVVTTSNENVLVINDPLLMIKLTTELKGKLRDMDKDFKPFDEWEIEFLNKIKNDDIN